MTKQPQPLIVGFGTHGKDTLAELITEEYGIKFRGSSQVASELVVYPFMRKFYPNSSACFKDRRRHRLIWYNLICQYNSYDPTRLAKAVCEGGYGYTGLRERIEVETALSEKLFTHVIWIEDPNKRKDDPTMKFDYGCLVYWKKYYPDFKLTYISNNGGIEDLRSKILSKEFKQFIGL